MVLPGYSPIYGNPSVHADWSGAVLPPTGGMLGGHLQTPTISLVWCASQVSMNSNVSKRTLPQLCPTRPAECRTLPGLCQEVAAPHMPPPAQVSPGGWPETCGVSTLGQASKASLSPEDGRAQWPAAQAQHVRGLWSCSPCKLRALVHPSHLTPAGLSAFSCC